MDCISQFRACVYAMDKVRGTLTYSVRISGIDIVYTIPVGKFSPEQAERMMSAPRKKVSGVKWELWDLR